MKYQYKIAFNFDGLCEIIPFEYGIEEVFSYAKNLMIKEGYEDFDYSLFRLDGFSYKKINLDGSLSKTELCAADFTSDYEEDNYSFDRDVRDNDLPAD